MRILPFPVGLKGTRRYLHGTDMYRALTSALAGDWPTEETGIELRYKRFALETCALHVAEVESEPPPARPLAQVTLSRAGALRRGWLVETGRPPSGTEPSFEPAIVARARVDGPHAMVDRPPEAPPIEALVFLTKRLHEATQPAAGTTLAFCGLSLRRLLTERDTAFAVTLRSEIQGGITESLVSLQGQEVGSIYFARLAGRPA